MDRVGEAFVWPFRDPQWLEKIAVIGLIGLIPIVGGINAYGWMMAAVRRLRTGEERLPPAGFDYLWPGFQLFVVLIVYYAALLAVAGVLFVPALILLISNGNSAGNFLLEVLGLLLLLLAFAITLAGSLALDFVQPGIVLGTLDGGIGGGLGVGSIARRIRGAPTNTLLAGLMLIAASFVGGLGIYVFFVGLVFTVPYALAVEAWVIRSYELGAGAPAAPEEALNVGRSAAAPER
jgi:Protein of unknown function (DUF4013)